MGILERCKTILSSNINAALDACEDSEKMVDQTCRDLRVQLAEVRKDTQAIMANSELASQRVREKEVDVAEYERCAMNALKCGDEAAARELLAKKQDAEQILVTLKETESEAKADAAEMRQAHDKLVRDIEAAEQRRDSLKGKARTAKAKNRMNKALSGTKRTEAGLAALDRMEDKVNRQLAEAKAGEALREGSTTDDLLKKYSTDSGSVDDELAAMKAKLGM